MEETGMNSFKKIVVTIDAKSDRHRALDEARAMMGDGEGGAWRIVLLHVVEPAAWYMRLSPKTQEIEAARRAGAEQLLGELASGLAGSGGTVVARVVVGKPAIEIVREVMREGADLLVVGAGSRERSSPSSLVLQLVRTAPCPVWIVRERAGEEAERARKILAAVDPATAEGGEDPLHLRVPAEAGRAQLDDAILDMAKEFARAWKAELHVVHAWSAPGEELLRGDVVLGSEQIDEYVDAMREAHREALDGLLARHPEISSERNVHMVKGSAAWAILDEVAALRPDLVVMGTVVRTGLPGIVMGNTADAVVRHAACSILALKPKGFVSPIAAED
jgi:nucleotide-binding universal stress UspA family protein